MTSSKRIAGLLGPVLIALSMSEAVNLRLLMSGIGATSIHAVYLNGTLLFVAGLSIVRAHNYWTRQWPLLVTLTGWLAIVAGLIRMFAPMSGAELGLDVTRPEQGMNAIHGMLIALLAVGLVLTVKAYQQSADTAERT